ncbi:MAG TPA: hypothetical protein VHJ20_02285, partial [Polyangia bacterium]|nr:hypothetical protein [Polyangia bacterium]
MIAALPTLPTLLALMLTPTLTVTAPTDGSADCPSPRQVSDALARLAPGLVAQDDAAPPLPVPDAGVAPPPTNLRLAVSGTPAGDVRIDLTDARGELVLRRLLKAPERAQLSDCTALAETTALIVERYLREVGYEAPPLPPPAPIAGPAPPPASPTTVTAPATPPP